MLALCVFGADSAGAAPVGREKAAAAAEAFWNSVPETKSSCADGYTDDGYFGVNWGWGGLADGYFLIDAMEHPRPEPSGLRKRNLPDILKIFPQRLS